MKRIGSWWMPVADQHLERYLKAEGEYQRPHRLASIEACRQRRLALDIGAHIGLWSRELSAVFEEVIAFEPVEEFRQCFIKNVTADNVSLFPFALGSSAGHVQLDNPPGNSGMSHITKLCTDGVEMRTVDSFEFEMVDFVKIDVEGFELYVLEGARQTLTRCRPVVTIEQKPHSATNYGIPQYAAAELLQSLGAVVQRRVVDDWILAWPEGV